MKKSEIKEIINSSIPAQNLCKVFLQYDEFYHYCFPLLSSDKLFLIAEENDFMLDGFSIRRFRDIERVEIKSGKYSDIIEAEGLLDNLVVPDIDVADWYSVFLSLEKLGTNIIIENKSLDRNESDYAIGKIIKVYKSKVYFRHFDAEGIWCDELLVIPYTGITSVSFSNRYVDVFSKYLD